VRVTIGKPSLALMMCRDCIDSGIRWSFYHTADIFCSWYSDFAHGDINGNGVGSAGFSCKDC